MVASCLSCFKFDHLTTWSRSLHQPSNDTSLLPSIINFPSYSVFSHSMHAPILHTSPMLLPQDSVCKSWLVTDLDSSPVQALCSHFTFALLRCHHRNHWFLPPTDTVSWSTVQNRAPMTTVQRIGMLCVLVLSKYTHTGAQACTCTHMCIYTPKVHSFT